MPTAPQPSFFVPRVPAESQEECYITLARACDCLTPCRAERIYSITYTHDRETWTATVGKQLTGRVTKTSRARGKKVERTVPLSNGATVMAIFPGAPFIVWHDGASKVWENPFLVGRPHAITYFAA